jgi:hypothetical protein
MDTEPGVELLLVEVVTNGIVAGPADCDRR